MNIGEVVAALKRGQRVKRTGWHGDHYLSFVPGGFGVEGGSISPFVVIHPQRKDGEHIVVPWLCSQTDLLAEDWEIIESPLRKG